DWTYYDAYTDIDTPVLGENMDALWAAEDAENQDEEPDESDEPEEIGETEEPEDPEATGEEEPEIEIDVDIDLFGNVFYVGYDPEKVYSSPDYAAISPNFDEYFDTLMIDLFPLRSADVVSLRVTNSDGVDISEILPNDDLAWRCISDDVEKVTPYGETISLDRLSANVYRLISDFGFRPYDGEEFYDDSELEENYAAENVILPDGEYLLTVTAKFTADSEKEETLEFPFRVDTAYPDVDFVSFRQEDGATYLDVSANDDVSLYSVSVNYSVPPEDDPESEEERNEEDDLMLMFANQVNVIYPVAAEKEASYSFDITGFDASQTVNISVQDYAGNTIQMYILPYTVTGIGDEALRWNKLGGEDLTFTLSAPEGIEPNTPESVSIDNELFFWLTPDCFTEDGFVLPATFLRNAEVGEHTLWINDELYNSTAVKLTVYEEASPTEDTTEAVQTSETTTEDVSPTAPTSPREELLMGDANGDGKVNSSDARTALRSAAGIEKLAEGSKEFLQADANRDGKVKANDARRILRASAKLEDPGNW
ncbi:MAG: dockerin type I repeat-containing protein, partial [Clostridia bacterium]|nr:dockerin type I repeat-containing protein [Clostridia bacterium]